MIFIIGRDHASLFIMSPPLAQVLDGMKGAGSPTSVIDPDTLKSYRSDGYHRSRESWHRVLATGIYKTRDDRFYHIHG